jgi:hypothetical protein
MSRLLNNLRILDTPTAPGSAGGRMGDALPRLQKPPAEPGAVCITALFIVLVSVIAKQLPAQEPKVSADESSFDVISPDQWERVDTAVERGLSWLASQQQADGAFPTMDVGQPGVTSLCMLALLAHGHVPGDGVYGRHIERATDYILKCQKPNGLVSLYGPSGARLTRDVEHDVGNCAAYNHGISSLTISELYGMSELRRAENIKAAIEKALVASLEMQRWPKDRLQDRGGWRYIDDYDACDSDLSITGWELKFLRSARNAGFNVPKQPIDDAVAYVRRCYSPQYGIFQYAAGQSDSRSRAMAGAGVLALAHAGFHNAPETKIAGDWILDHGFQDYNVHLRFHSRWQHDRYHYALFNCCQGMYQLGGRYWKDFFPPVVETVLANQQPDGSWPADGHNRDGQFGNAYTTALVLLTLGAPNQLLPIYQR